MINESILTTLEANNTSFVTNNTTMVNESINATGFLNETVNALNATLNATMGTIADYSQNNSLIIVYNAFNRIDPVSIIMNLIVISIITVGTILVAKVADRMLDRYFQRISEKMLKGSILKASGVAMDVAMDKTTRLLVRRIVVASIYLLGLSLVILQIDQLREIAVAMLAGAGLATVAIGFAAKDALANLISGVFIAIFQPFRVGDYVTFNDEYGHIEDLTLRHTIICTWDKRRIVVPNSTISIEPIINWSLKDPVSSWTVTFGISYSADIDKAKKIIIEEAKKHPQVINDCEITVRVTELADSSVNLRLLFNVNSRDVAFETGCDIREAVKKRFDKEGVEIPFPYRNVILKKES